MPALPFDSVSVLRDGRHVRMSAEAFLALPMFERVHLILERAVQFYTDGVLMDRSEALKHLRRMQ